MAGRQSPFGTSDCQGGFLRSLDLRKDLVHLLLALVSQRTCLYGIRIARGERRFPRGSGPQTFVQMAAVEVWPTDTGGCLRLTKHMK